MKSKSHITEGINDIDAGLDRIASIVDGNNDELDRIHKLIGAIL